ncbi:hypothetical protein LCGC14_2172280 [marine sediment metagenome]|uniref:Uncharacterized protein n=1 Tax=marine sediment metagenome TaxID=412755 RepID=A0A0F9G2D1_9ZZZZ
MSVSVTSTNVGVPAPKLYSNLVFGAESIQKGIMEVIQDKRHKIPLNKFIVAANDVIAPQDTPSTSVDATTKSEVLITTGELEKFDKFSPSDFNDDWRFLNSAGPSADVEFAPAIRAAIEPLYVRAFNTDVEQIIWRGNTGGAGIFLRFNGLLVTGDADGTLNSVTPAGAITSANVIAIFGALTAALPAVVKGTTTPFIVCNHTDYFLYHEALRALDSKGINLDVGGFTTFSGYRLVPVSGMPAGRLWMTHDQNIKLGMWAQTDLTNVLVARMAPHSRVWGIKLTAEMGVNYLIGAEIADYITA